MVNEFAFHEQTLGIIQKKLNLIPGVEAEKGQGDSQSPNLIIQTSTNILMIVIAPYGDLSFEISVLSKTPLDENETQRLQLVSQDSESQSFSRITHANDVLSRVNDILKLETVAA